MEDSKSPSNRRDFLALAATAAAGMGAMLPVGTAAAAAGSAPADVTEWLNSIPGKYRQVTDWPDFNNGMGLIYTSNFLTTGAAGYGVLTSDMGAVLVLRHDTIPIAFSDSVWAKYKLGAMFKINDPDTNAPAIRNAYYHKPGALPFPEAALSKLIERGVKVVACNLALTFWSSVVAQKMGLKHEDVKQEWTDAVYPGIKLLPSGLFACNAAQSRGCQYLFAG
jgi:intracellular sulfur oxidation DsrE/DsrF family protein